MDTLKNCTELAGKKDCFKNPNLMTEFCPAACDKCGTAVCL